MTEETFKERLDALVAEFLSDTSKETKDVVLMNLDDKWHELFGKGE